MMISTENPYSVFFGCGMDMGRHPGAERFAERPGDPPFSDYIDKPFDFELFYSFFPEFEPPDTGTPSYSEDFMSGVAKQAAMFVKATQCRELDGRDRQYAYFLTVAHMAVLVKNQQLGLNGTSTPSSGIAGGATADTMPGVMTSASVGSVSVSKTGIFNPRNFWEAWYLQTPYGRTLLAFLEQQVATGFMYEGEENIADCLRD